MGEFKGDVLLVAVNLEVPETQITGTLQRHKLQLTVALNRDGAVAPKYAVTAIPQTVVIDRTGNVARLFIGGGPKLPGPNNCARRCKISSRPAAARAAAAKQPGYATCSGVDR